MYFNRIRPHDADAQRRKYAIDRATKLDSVRQHFIDWCFREGKSQQEMNEGLFELDQLVEVWQDVADQSKVD